MSSRKVLIAWELGSGLGHLACLYPILRALRERGCEPLVAVPDPAHARSILGAESPQFLKSVPLAASRHRQSPPESFAQLLLQRGFADIRALSAATRAWQDMFRAESIAALMLDYAPVAQLAGWLSGLPMASWTTSFANPPVPVPCFHPEQTAAVRTAQASERRLLSAINAVAAEHGRPPIESLARWLHAPRRLMTGLRETNVYDSDPDAGYLGPLGELPGTAPFDWPTNEGKRRVLAYLRWMPQIPRLLADLQRADRDIAAVISGAPATWLTSLDGRAHLRATASRVHLSGLLASAHLVLSNGSAGFASQTLVAGKPHFILPIDIEKHLIAEKLSRLGLARGTRSRRSFKAQWEEFESDEEQGRFAGPLQKLSDSLRPKEWSANLQSLVQFGV